jgi:hypothetical protein
MKIKIIAEKPTYNQIHPITQHIGQVFEVIERDPEDTENPNHHSVDMGGETGVVIVNPGEYEVVPDETPTTLDLKGESGKITTMNDKPSPAEIKIRKAAKLLEGARRDLQLPQTFTNDGMPAAAITKIAHIQVDLAVILDLFKP